MQTAYTQPSTEDTSDMGHIRVSLSAALFGRPVDKPTNHCHQSHDNDNDGRDNEGQIH